MTGSRQYDPTVTSAPSTAAPSTAPSTTEVAKGQAFQVAGGAADAAQHVAGVAKEQVGQVAAATGQQVKELAGKAQSELSGQAKAQQRKLAGGLHSVGEQLKSMAEKSEQQGVATSVAHQVADKAHQIAGWLEDRTSADLLTELRSFAQRRPGSFLAAALAAGAAAGRMARGLSSDPAEKGRATPPALQKPAAPRAAVGGSAASPALPAGLPLAGPDPDGAAPVRDWTTPRSGDLGNLR